MPTRYTVYRASGAGWAPYTTSQTPPSQISVPYFGFAADSDSDWSGLSAAVGGILVSRTYNTPADGVPVSYSASSAKHDAARGASISSISIRPAIADTASGALDAAISAFARSCPAGTWITYWPEIDAITRFSTPASQAVPAYQRFYNVAKSANPSCWYGPCYMTFTWSSSASGYPPSQWFTTSDGGFISGDFIGLDGYNQGTGSSWQSFADVFSPAVTWLKARTSIPIVVCETGTVADPANSFRRGDWWAGVFAQAQAWGMPLVCGWQGSAVPQYTIFNPSDSAALSAISTLNAASKAR